LKKRARKERDLVKKKDPARAAPAFSIVAADREPGKGYHCKKVEEVIIFFQHIAGTGQNERKSKRK